MEGGNPLNPLQASRPFTQAVIHTTGAIASRPLWPQDLSHHQSLFMLRHATDD